MTQKPDITAGRKALFYLLAGLFTLVAVFVAGEITVRLMGHQPWQPDRRQTKVMPEGHFFQLDSLPGYAMRPGDFTLTLNDSLAFSVSHERGPDGRFYRKTSAVTPPDSLPEIWIFGGSFTYGWGVDDAESWPARVQRAFPAYRVRNFGVGGYGNYQSLLLFNDLVHAGLQPEIVVLAYAGFHNQRNVCSPFWLQAIATQEVLAGLKFPFLRTDGPGLEPVSGYAEVEYSPFPGNRFSALIHFFEQKIMAKKEAGYFPAEVTKHILFQMQSNSLGIEAMFVLAGIGNDEITRETLQVMKDRGIHTVDISVDLSNAAFNLQPQDPHPNARAHAEYANRLGSFLKTALFSDSLINQNDMPR